MAARAVLRRPDRPLARRRPDQLADSRHAPTLQLRLKEFRPPKSQRVAHPLDRASVAVERLDDPPLASNPGHIPDVLISHQRTSLVIQLRAQLSELAIKQPDKVLGLLLISAAVCHRRTVAGDQIHVGPNEFISLGIAAGGGGAGQ
jgi:hypothetical protein